MNKFRNYDNYEVYEDGRIWSYKTKRFLKPQTVKCGYQLVRLFDNEGKPKYYLLHRVIYESFSGEPIPPNMQVNHIDERKDNNARSNLNLMTPKQNCNWGTGIERRSKAVKNSKKLSKALTNNPKKSKPVGAFKNGKLVMKFPSANEAGRNGFNQGSVSACCRNCLNRPGNNIYKGFEWRYL